MKKLIYNILVALILLGFTNNSNAQKQVERLNRGAIAVRQGEGYLISWRLLADEPYSTGFNIYKGTSKINDTPITDVTSYFDPVAISNSYYYVRAIVDGNEISDNVSARIINQTQGSNAGYFDIPLNKPSNGTNGGSYSPNDASTGDLNGDGELDIVLKWDPSNSKDNSQKGTTDNVFLDGYTLDGKQLWRIDLGPNIRAGAHYTQFLVFDFDGNGKAEIMVKTAPGTKDASGYYLRKGPAENANHNQIYRNSNGYILSGPEYITVFDGETGMELATENYWPSRGNVKDWGDSYGNRLDRYNATVAYVDGQRPTAIFQRGYYTRLSMAAWNWRDGQLTKEWTFDSNNAGNGKYYGQGNHSIHVTDVNGDGLDDIVTGSAVISGTGEGLVTTGAGHGDACHVTYMKKNDDRPMIFMCHEESPYGMSLRYAEETENIFRHGDNSDTGRGCAGELDPEVPGFKFWSVKSRGLVDLEGNKVGSYPSSVNFVIWWNGELSRELMNSNTIEQWSIKSNRATRLLTGDGTSSNNGTKSTPTLQADIFGDWREEVILRLSSNNALRVFTSTMPTKHKLFTFMHDPIYRCQISSQNSSYNQPPHPGSYIATDMDFPQKTPNVQPIAGIYRGSGEIIKNLTVSDAQNANDWEIASELTETSSVYGNKTMFPSPLPEYLKGGEWIKTSTESRSWNISETLASFEITEDAQISVVISADITDIPSWLSTYTLNSEELNISSPISGSKPMVIYSKKCLKGDKISLGPNTNNGSTNTQMYFVVAQKTNQTAFNQLKKNNKQIKVFPNPFCQKTQIEYELNNSQLVSIGLYDLNGKLYRSIDKGIKKSGINTTQIDGSTIPSGIYFIKLIASGMILQEKVLLMK